MGIGGSYFLPPLPVVHIYSNMMTLLSTGGTAGHGVDGEPRGLATQ